MEMDARSSLIRTCYQIRFTFSTCFHFGCMTLKVHPLRVEVMRIKMPTVRKSISFRMNDRQYVWLKIAADSACRSMNKQFCAMIDAEIAKEKGIGAEFGDRPDAFHAE